MKESRLPRAPKRHVNISAWVTIGGQRFYARSKAEATHAAWLESCVMLGRIVSWEHEPETFHFANVKSGPASYKPDFRVVMPEGTQYHEVKGYWTRRDVTKMRLMAKHHPNVVVKVYGASLARADVEKIEAARAKALERIAIADRKAARELKRFMADEVGAKMPRRKR